MSRGARSVTSIVPAPNHHSSPQTSSASDAVPCQSWPPLSVSNSRDENSAVDAITTPPMKLPLRTGIPRPFVQP